MLVSLCSVLAVLMDSEQRFVGTTQLLLCAKEGKAPGWAPNASLGCVNGDCALGNEPALGTAPLSPGLRSPRPRPSTLYPLKDRFFPKLPRRGQGPSSAQKPLL